MRVLGPAMCALAVLASGCGSSIHDAVGRHDLDLVASMLDAAPALIHNTNSKAGQTPLHYAVLYGAAELIPLLLERGADVNAKDRTGLTPLHAAAMIGRAEEAVLLMDRGADKEARDKFGDTPLHFAAIHGQAGMVRLLHEAGADLSTRNDAGLMPLDSARRYARDSVAEYIAQANGTDEQSGRS